MVRVTFWLQLLLVVFTLRQSAADSDVGGGTIKGLPSSSSRQKILKGLEELEERNKLLVSRYYVINRHYEQLNVA
jgi:DNA-directed RNA polymerase specialized sigma subunit